MKRLRSPVVLGVVIAALFAGAAVAYAGFGWWWNAVVDVEGTQVRTIWQVDDEGGANNYQASIKVWLPLGADADVIQQAPNESVQLLQNAELKCDSGAGIVEAAAWYRVRAVDGTVGAAVAFSVQTADGQVLGSATGTVGGEPAKLAIAIPVPNPTCN